jgi:multicomponent Na+:H+ antiporter subunit D
MIWQHLLIVPVILPLAGAIVTTVIFGRWGAWVVLVTSLLTLGADALVLQSALIGGPLVYRVGDWVPPYGIVLVADRFSASLALVSSIVAVASTLQTLVTGAEVAHRRLFHPMFLLLLTGLSGVFLSGDLFNLYVFMEIVILTSIVLVAMANRPISAETTFKYTVLAALGSTVLLACIALTYAGIGTLNIADIGQRVRQGDAPHFWPVIAAMMLFVFLLKGAVFPFHFWQPDAHSAAPSSVSAMLSGVLVKVGIYGIVRMSTILFPDSPVLLTLAPLGAVSAIFGGLAAVTSGDLKRMLAYSTISNIGLIVLALGWGGQMGLTAAFVHTINHALIKGSLFLSAGYVTERLNEHSMNRLGGLALVAPGTAAAFGLGALALAGLPPLSGYLSKLTLIEAGIAAGDSTLLIAAILASALGIGYSLRAFALVYWGQTPEWIVERWAQYSGGGISPLAPLALALIYLALGIWPAPLMELTAAVVAELTRPDIYIHSVLGGAS